MTAFHQYKRRQNINLLEAVQYLPGVNDDLMRAFLEDCRGWQVTKRGIEWPGYFVTDVPVVLRPNEWAVRDERKRYWSVRHEYFTSAWERVI